MYQHILVPVDSSATSDRGLDEAIRLAGMTGGRLRLLHVIDDLSLYLAVDPRAGFSLDLVGQLRDVANQLVAQAGSIALAHGIRAETVVRDRFEGRVHDIVLAEADSWPADLIVMGSHGRRGFNRLLLGSAAEHVLRLARVPVLLVRAPRAPAVATSL